MSTSYKMSSHFALFKTLRKEKDGKPSRIQKLGRILSFWWSASVTYMLGLLLQYLFSIFLNFNFFRGCSQLISFPNMKYIPVERDFQSHQNKTRQRLYFIVYLKMLQHLLPWPKRHLFPLGHSSGVMFGDQRFLSCHFKVVAEPDN